MNTQATREDQLAAAIAHAGILIPWFGAVIPLAVWLSQRERSPLVRFQALQALAYQLLGLLAYLVLWGCQMLGFFGFFSTMVITGGLGSAVQNSHPEAVRGLAGIIFILFILFFGLMALLIVLQCIGGPLYVILALVGSWRVLNDKPFQYPLIGKWIYKRLEAGQTGQLMGVEAE
jgi:uncharacterized Tic20 family protein